MRIVALMWRQSAPLFLLCILSDAVNAVSNLGLILLVSKALRNPSNVALLWPQFVLLIALVIATTLLSSAAVNRLVSGCTLTMRQDLLQAIFRTPLRMLEEIGPPRWLTTLGEDVGQVGVAMPGLIGVLRNFVFLTVALGYLGWMSPIALVLVVAATAVSIVTHHVCWRYASRILELLGKQREIASGIGRDLADGLKQLKLSRRQRDQMTRSASQNQQRINALQQRSALIFSLSGSLHTVWIFSLPLLMIYGTSIGLLGPEIGYTAPLLMFFVLTPLIAVMQGFQTNAQATFALNRIRDLTGLLERELETHAEGGADAAGDKPAIQRIEARSLSYTYQKDGEPTLVIGPIDITLHAGESLFIAGGNGSGKTTAGKMLCGLYVPGAGSLIVDGVEIDESNRHLYRANVSALFSDFSLFHSLSGSDYDRQVTDTSLDMFGRTRLSHLQLSRESLLAQAAHFSTGERRRVALLLLLMEKNQIILFDEFAAEQDAEHKAWFYDELLPWLKQAGKIVIAITHDLRFLDRADVSMVFDRGNPPVCQRAGDRTAAFAPADPAASAAPLRAPAPL
ncbi:MULTISPECIES: ATP-binding cassette domain-containing protein [Xanthomonas]|uniref:ATP-binding cassette domain-containing protein n=1 Tax=Xanthomonas TaxID=338 RepID=UPI000C862E8F|nr:ATP-binding cassette domain-containing protein [Xanthomonas arboricola]QDS16132.1 ATP-binding cassette domain-containing protein [Xanthomonas arboricola]SOU07144.1 peptide ABC transporter ATP-binding protein [Xanthomonas arboricola pv. fragariae]